MSARETLEPVLTPERIRARVAELAAEIGRDHQGRELLLVGILKGAFIFLSDLARALPAPCRIDFVRLASYGASDQSSGRIELKSPCTFDPAGKTVLVVEDIVDTGLTLDWFLRWLKEQGAAAVKTCALVDKPERRQVPLFLDYVGFQIPRGFLVGYGLDYAERYRSLPGIYEVVFAQD